MKLITCLLLGLLGLSAHSYASSESAPAKRILWSDAPLSLLDARKSNMDWKDGRLTKAVIRAGENSPGKCIVRHGGKTTRLDLASGEEKTLTAESFR